MVGFRRPMQPNHQIVQEKVSIDRDNDIALENIAGPSAASSKMDGVCTRNMACHGADRRLAHLYGEVHFPSFAPASVNGSTAPEKHAFRCDG
jgi:hypothetical protein